jgi:predicted nucleic acid-binding Zn ribbon protein
VSPTRLFACLSCGHHFEISRVVADSSLNMTLCPQCSGHEIQNIGEGSRESATRPVLVEPTPPEPVPA